jgi:hypothetical protein
LLCAFAAVAAPAPATAAQRGAAALPGAAVRSHQTAFDSTPTKTATVHCPAGTRVTGGGGRVDGVPGHVVLTRMRPVHTNNLDRFEVSAAEDETGTPLAWAVTAIGVCASPVDGMEIVSVTRAGDDSLYNYALVTCPTGKLPIGGGGQITGGKGQVHLGYMRDPFSASTLAQGLEDANSFDGDWTVTADAVCVPVPPPGSVRTVIADSDVNSTNPKEVTATCPAGMSITGGAGISFGNGDRNAVLQSVAPAALPGGLPGREVTVVARENNPIGGTWSVRAVAFCHI